MQLSKQTIKNIKPGPGLKVPPENAFSLPEKVIQFGTGVLLRGLPDYFIDKANRQGLFNGRILVVKSTSHGDVDAFDKQDGLYTHYIRGVENGKKIEETIINSSISRVVAAQDNWDTILECAHDPGFKIVISNTTEVGITLVQDDVRLSPPLSFPGKLLAFLLERFRAFNGSKESGMVIIPTELITDNGTRLRSVLLDLARLNKLEPEFTKWLEEANCFCNSLVDRIVPGKLPAQEQSAIEEELGYTDELMILSESFRLWAIESADPRVKDVLSFAAADEGVVIAPDIEKFRELKLRLLNGTHTFSCALAHLSGFTTVRETMANEAMSSFIHHLAVHEIAVAIQQENLPYEEAVDFAGKVLDRFRNPYLDHRWLSISVQYSSKMKMRNVPLLQKYFTRTQQVPEYMVMGFAAYLLFMKGREDSKGLYESVSKGEPYVIQDDHAGTLSRYWENNEPGQVVDAVLSDHSLWGTDLSQLKGFSEAVKHSLQSLLKNGVMETIQRTLLNKTAAG